MCGIVGQWNNKQAVDRASFQSMVDALSQRGPDSSDAIYFDDAHTALGHTRLSIIDLSELGKQPMCNEDETLWLSFNGEIYNYQALRKELIQHGHTFKSESDSEVLLHGFEQWNKGLLSKIRGIFAFAIYDTKSRFFFLARDQAGIKPLYYYTSTQTFVFGSEPKAILPAEHVTKQINRQGLSLYLAYGNLPGEHSIFEGMKKVLPGHYLVYGDGKVQENAPYWQLTYNPVIRNEEEAIEAVRDALTEAIRIQCASDVPIASLLSGGVDSTIVTGELQRFLPYSLNTFNIGFNVATKDESGYAALVAQAFGTMHKSRQLSSDKAFEDWHELIQIFDEPFLASSLFPYLALSKLTRENGFKVAMGGDGADELFAGYKWYDHFNKSYQIPFYKSIIQKLKGTFAPFANAYQRFSKYNGYFFEEAQQSLFPELSAETLYEPVRRNFNQQYPAVLAGQIMDYHVFLPDHCLTKVDRISMSQGLEVRVPFLDQKLVELIFQIDHTLMYKGEERKWLLKKAMAVDLPENMDHKRKKGFSSPIDTWWNKGVSNEGRHLLNNGSFLTDANVPKDAMLSLYENSTADGQLVLLGLEQWHRYWVEGDKNPAVTTAFI
jgi:asparagine synthase (glutamine-hydrolysing)